MGLQIKLYREKKLHPWKYCDRLRSEDELEQEVDRVFSMYCTLDTASYNVEIDQKVLKSSPFSASPFRLFHFLPWLLSICRGYVSPLP